MSCSAPGVYTYEYIIYTKHVNLVSDIIYTKQFINSTLLIINLNKKSYSG